MLPRDLDRSDICLLSESEKDGEPGACGVCSRGPGEKN